MLIVALLPTLSLSAADSSDSQDESWLKEWQLKVRVGYNIGGTAPLLRVLWQEEMS